MSEPADLSAGGKAFRLKATLADAVPHPAWVRARQAALRAVRAGRPVLLLGLPGSGKTLLLQELARHLREERRGVALPGPGEVPVADDEIPLVDEAGSLAAPALAELAGRGGAFILAALPASAAGLVTAIPALVTVRLDPLAEEEVADYVAARLAAAGQPPDLLEPGAVSALAQRSGGLLRLVNTLGGAATFLAGMDGATWVARRHVEEADTMRKGAEAHADGPALATISPGAAALPARPPPLAEAGTRPVLSRAGAAGRRRARYLGAVTAVAVLAMLSGLALLRSPPPEAPALPRAYNTVPAPAAPPEPARAEPAPSAPLPGPASVSPRPAPAADAAAAPVPARSPDRGRAPRPVPEGAATFRGTVFNETLRQSGRLLLSIRPVGPPGVVSVRFEASAGLVGSGELSGTLDPEGHLAASGTLLMGRNPHETELRGTINGNSLSGDASFRRPTMTTGRTRSTFRLARD